MTLSSSILLEVLADYRLESHLSPQDDRRYAWVSILPGRIRPLRSDILHVCTLSEALFFNREQPGFHYLAIRDRLPDSDETEEALSGILVVNENLELGTLFNLVQERFLQIANWVDQMKSMLVAGCQYQDLLDQCEPILGNAVYILDAAYRLLAHTRNILSEDPINRMLLEKGYHSDEIMEKFKESRRFQAYEKEQGLIINQADNPAAYATVGKWLRFAGVPQIHIIMVCNNREPTPGLVELFQLLVDQLTVCFDREYRLHPSNSLIYHGLIMDMLFGKLSNPRIIAERARSVNQPLQGKFDVYRIVFDHNEAVPVGRFAEELFTLLPGVKIVYQNNEVIVLNSYGPSANVRADTKRNLERIRLTLEKYGGRCGVSEPFMEFLDLPSAYTQAAQAQGLGLKFLNAGNLWGFDKGVWNALKRPTDRNIFFYEDILFYYMIFRAQSDLFDVFQRTRFNEIIVQLEEYDRTNKTNNLQTLYVFLQSERRATVAGELLHMHRNNVLYRIAKIEELTGVSLDDPETRLHLILAFRYWELQKADQLEAEFLGN